MQPPGPIFDTFVSEENRFMAGLRRRPSFTSAGFVARGRIAFHHWVSAIQRIRRNHSSLKARLHSTSFMLSIVAILAGLSSQMLTSCGGTTKQTWQSSIPGAALHGSVTAGQSPISGAAIQLFAAGTESDGAPATPLLAKPVKSDSNGAFNISSGYVCPSSSSLVYLTSTGGNPGLPAGTQNASAALMTAMGPCGTLNGESAISLNETTTAASVLPLTPFMTSYQAVGADNAESGEIQQAFSNIHQFLAAKQQGSQEAASTGNISAETAAAIAKALLPCLTSPGGTAHDGSTCGQLFAEAESEAGEPITDTIGAALALAKNPGGTLANLASGSSSGANVGTTATVATVAAAAMQTQLTKVSPAMAASASPGTSSSPVPPNSVFTPPAPNACQSKYDQYYEAEPGVYAYWPLCEAGAPAQIFDYVGPYDLTSASHSFGTGVVTGGAPGPVPDGETAAGVPTATVSIENQGIPLNTNQGTLSTWVNANALTYPVTTAFFSAVQGLSGVSITVNAVSVSGAGTSKPTGTGGLCFNGNFTNSAGAAFKAQSCGYTANAWHRVTFTWRGGTLSLYVDGVPAANATYTGALDNLVFYYRLFPGCCPTGQQMTLAKIVLANQAWSAMQAAEDLAPAMPTVPVGGVYVSTTKLGTIHKDVLGYADYSQDISTPARESALISGLKAAGFTALRYSGGRGLKMDLEYWKTPMSCANTPGAAAVATPQSVSLANNLDTYLPQVAQPLGLDVTYTVNYGSNPPLCNAGGDPIVNAANLVQYANKTQGYKITRWEIGNEVWTSNTPDFHPHPNTGASYVTYEPAFYTAMKAEDPTIQIGVPIGANTFAYQSVFDLPVLGQAKYDAIIWHNYPMKDTITDGNTLYQDRVASNMNRVRGSLLKLQTELLNNNKSGDALWITEWNSSVLGGKWSKQTMGAVMPLFAATQLAEYMRAGVQLATWWAQGGTEVCSTLNYDGAGETAYSWWECGMSAPVYTGPMIGVGEVSVGLKPGDLTPVGRAFQLLSQSGFVTEGEHMLNTQTDVENAPWLLSYAATHGSSYAVILINRDRDNAHTVPVSIRDWTSGHSAQQWTYGRAQYDATQNGNWSVGPVTSTFGPWSGKFQAVLPPWSVNVIIFNP
jgi:hypothetical protein